MVRVEQPTFQRERPIRLIAKNGKNMIIDPKPKEITPATVCWPMERYLDQLSWAPTMLLSMGQKDKLVKCNMPIGKASR